MSYQSDYSGAQVDEAVGKALNPDATPTTGSANLVQSGGVASAVSAVMGSISHRNLLDNWFFANPVNQRGLTSYSTNNAYSIDRWKYFGNISMTLQSDGIRLGDTTSNTVTYISQIIEFPQLLAGRTLTFSVLVKDLAGTGNKGFILWYASGTEQTFAIITGELTTLTLTIPSSPTSLYFNIGSYWNNAFTVVSAKLELGSVSTLANDAPPCFAEELAKCQRYYWEMKASAAYALLALGMGTASNIASFKIQHPVTMRDSASVTASGTFGCNSASFASATFRNNSGTKTTNYSVIEFDTTISQGAATMLQDAGSNNAKLVFSAEL